MAVWDDFRFPFFRVWPKLAGSVTATNRHISWVFHESARYDLVGQRDGQLHRVAKLLFEPDGSIYVVCPTFRDTRGLVGIAKVPVGTDPISYRLQDFGLTTRHLVKYAHHPDGEAHFSQDGRVRTLVRRRSTPLSELSGHLCSILAKPISRFPAPKGKDLQLSFLNLETDATLFTVMRFRRSELSTDAEDGGSVGALTLSDGKTYQGVFAAPPRHFAHSEFFLFIYADPASVSTSTDSCLMLLGGFDPPTISLDRTRTSEYLVFMYPNPEVEELEKSLTSIDLAPPSLR